MAGNVKFVRELPFTVETVWAALTEADQLANWFGGLSLDARQGSKFEIWFSENCEGAAHVSGHVTEYSPPNLLVLGNQRWELLAKGKGCVLTFTDLLFFDDRDKRDFSNSVLAGWHKYLDSLERLLRGGRGDPRVDSELDYSKLEIPGRV